MPYPGKDLNATLKGPWTMKYFEYGVNTGTYQGEVGYQTRMERHPSSITNPVKPDGTRAMSGWSHSGGRWRSASNAAARQQPRGYPPGTYWQELSGCFPTADIRPNELQVWKDGAVMSRLRALASWTERQVEYNAALRQAGQTAKMVGDLGKGLANQLFDAASRKGATGINARNWKKLPGWYLEYLYGWAPLADDIANGVDKLIDEIRFNDSHLDVNLVGKWSGRGEMTFDNALGSTWGSNNTTDTTLQLKQFNKTVMRYRIPFDRLENLQPLGFFGTQYELAPFSFVLDWVLPVGTWLNALDANALAIYFVEGSTSEMVRATSSSTRLRYPGGGGGTLISGVAGYDVEIQRWPFRFQRILETPWSITSRVPFRTDLNLSHAAQGLSLLAQALARIS